MTKARNETSEAVGELQARHHTPRRILIFCIAMAMAFFHLYTAASASSLLSRSEPFTSPLSWR